MKIGDPAPTFTLPDGEGNEHSLETYRGKWVVFYFYPKDNTPGCTNEAIGFSQAKDAFEKEGAVILGVSPDSPKSHCNFRDKHNLTITLLSDKEKEVAKKYGVWQLKKRCGKESWGIVRSTFLIDPEGKIAHIWENVKVKGHVEEVLETLKNIKK